jgi:class 3 adenylate cyclase
VPGRIEQLRGAPARVTRNISVASRLAFVVVLVALVSVVVTSLVGLERGATLADAEISDRLAAVGAARADQVERYVASLERSVVGQALTPRVADAIDGFSQQFRELATTPASTRDQAAVDTFYRTVVAAELTAARDRPVRASTLAPLTDAGVTLQAEYVVPELDDSPTRTRVPEWAEIHDPLDEAFQEFAFRVGFDDFYLIEPRALVVVYSTAKDIDFATSLRAGPHSGSQLAALVDQLADDPAPGDVVVRDFAAYAPAGDRSSAFVGSPVFDDGELAGFVAGRFSTDELTAIMTNDQNWGTLGDTGETYVVASDARMRSDSRVFLEDSAAYFEQVEAARTATDEEIRSMRFFDTTALFQRIDALRVGAIFDDGSVADGSVAEETTGYLGQEVLSDARRVAIDDLEWAVVAEAELAVIRQPITDFTRNLLVTIAVFIVVVTFLAVRWADRLLEPLRLISARLRTIRDGGDASERTELPDGSAGEFVELAGDIDTMLDTLRLRTETARRRADERRSVLRRLLPASIAERAEAGDRDVVEHVANSAVAVVVIGGLGALVSDGSTDRARRLLDRFVAEADDLAAERGLDRLQLSGDAYVAACGVSRPYLDHAARAAAFVLEVREMLDDLDHDGELYLRAGLDVGPITVGLTGGSRLVHDTWGATVQGANDLARSAQRGEVQVSAACRRLLPTDLHFESTGRDDVSVLRGVRTDSGAAT